MSHEAATPAAGPRKIVIRNIGLLLSGSLVVLFLLAQRRKQQREDMEKLLQFTSHEFKTPVAGVKGLLQSLAIGSIPDAQRADVSSRQVDRGDGW